MDDQSYMKSQGIQPMLAVCKIDFFPTVLFIWPI